ncbi:hypothetical protein, partial [uncultured Enterococcus sp.]|uniref:hypothetical protein n=1 Tax=uncultured Enterococcus sp. TaxID=167972 RepID=UPI0028048781
MFSLAETRCLEKTFHKKHSLSEFQPLPLIESNPKMSERLVGPCDLLFSFPIPLGSAVLFLPLLLIQSSFEV